MNRTTRILISATVGLYTFGGLGSFGWALEWATVGLIISGVLVVSSGFKGKIEQDIRGERSDTLSNDENNSGIDVGSSKKEFWLKRKGREAWDKTKQGFRYLSRKTKNAGKYLKEKTKNGIYRAGNFVFKDRSIGLNKLKDKAGEKLNNLGDYSKEKYGAIQAKAGEKLSDLKDYSKEKHADLVDYTKGKHEQLEQYLGETKNKVRETYRNKKGQLVELYRDQSGKLRDFTGNLVDEAKLKTEYGYERVKKVFRKGEKKTSSEQGFTGIKDPSPKIVEWDLTKKSEERVGHILDEDIKVLSRLEDNLSKILLNNTIRSELKMHIQGKKNFLLNKDIAGIKKIYPLLKKKILKDMELLEHKRDLKIAEQYMADTKKKLKERKVVVPNTIRYIEERMINTERMLTWLRELNKKINVKELRKQLDKIHDTIKKDSLDEILGKARDLSEDLDKVIGEIESLMDHIRTARRYMEQIRSKDIKYESNHALTA